MFVVVYLCGGGEGWFGNVFFLLLFLDLFDFHLTFSLILEVHLRLKIKQKTHIQYIILLAKTFTVTYFSRSHVVVVCRLFFFSLFILKCCNTIVILCEILSLLFYRVCCYCCKRGCCVYFIHIWYTTELFFLWYLFQLYVIKYMF